MWWFITLPIAYILIFYETVEQELESVEYDCSSYFLELDLELLQDTVNKKIEEKCIGDMRLAVIDLTHNGSVCEVVYQYDPSKRRFVEQPKCTEALQEIMSNAHSVTWGHPWGCPTSDLKVPVTSYYSTTMRLNAVYAASLREGITGFCEVSSLRFRASTTVYCTMNAFGGYYWDPAPAFNSCAISEFAHPTLSFIDKFKGSPMYCSYRMFFYLGYLKLYARNNLQRVRRLLNAMQYECAQISDAIFSAMYKGFLRLMDNIAISLMEQEEFRDHPELSIPTVNQLLTVFATTIVNHYKEQGVQVFHRNHRMYVYYIPRNNSENLYTCANRFYIEIYTITRPFIVACTERFNVLRRESLFETYVAAGFLWIQPETPTPFAARITYHLPSFHQPGQYMCARYSASFEGLHRSRLRGCRVERFSRSEVTCICDEPGYFALLQDRPTLGRFGVQMVNKLNKPTTSLMHGFVSMCLGYCILLHFSIRWIKGGLKIYSGNKLNPNREKTFLDWTIQMHLILLARLLLQLASIKMNFTRDCELPGAMQHVITLLVGVFSLIHSVIVLVVSRTLTPQHLLLKTCLVIYVLSGVACTTLYLSDLSDYDYINCLPDRMLYTLTWPSVALFASSALFLSLYWIFRPYQNMDEWFGALGNVVLNLFIWSSLTVDSGISRYATTAVIRLTNMNLIHAFLSSVYHGIFKWSTLQFYWRLTRIVHHATLKQVTTVTSTVRESHDETVEDRPAVEERLELTVFPNTEELAVGLFKTESKLTRKKRRIGHRPTVNLRAAASRLDDFSGHVRYNAYRRPTMRHTIRLDGEARVTRISRARRESS